MDANIFSCRFPIAAFFAALFTTVVALAGEVVAARDEELPAKSNVVILFADNLAYNDVGAFQTPRPARSRTPRTDALAGDGLKLLHWNSPAVLCSASRAALLTGRYPVRTGVYPRVFEPDAAHGLLANETTIADRLRDEGYATKIVGKWHLGSRPGYLPTDRGFDEWFGIPYHMSGGSLDEHVCGKEKDPTGTQWLPLFDGHDIVEQPVNLRNLGPRYVDSASDFIRKNAASSRPFFLYMAFSHVHQLCAPRINECQWASEHFSRTPGGFAADFGDAVEEMDWILGGVLDALRDAGVEDDTLVIFTSDNGPWTAERSCSGSKGQFEGRWLKENVDEGCTACPSEYVHSPLSGRPRRCVYPNTDFEVEGVHCGEDSGLGSAWEANVRMPAIVRWKNGNVPLGKESYAMVSTLDVLPTVLSLIGKEIPSDETDGVNVRNAFLGRAASSSNGDGSLDHERPIFFWRDGFQTGPLPPPFGRFDVVAMKLGWIKIWFWTKSSHYNDDEEVHHDPPLLFDVLNDPAESNPLDPNEHTRTIQNALSLLSAHKASVEWTRPLTLSRDPKYLPCSNLETGCRTFPPPSQPRVEYTQAEE
mmetsp:Transcript_54156/g.115070  ORF Transcript_54156/g.115070 Transcript_54156/m.115070 type:complete len:590 (-) Transcript_54156:261-2030(-)